MLMRASHEQKTEQEYITTFHNISMPQRAILPIENIE
jgi:hypothetical protein